MGANFRACGYLSTTLYMNDCAATEDKQLAVMVGFLKASPKLVAGLKVRDWTAVAVGYNGPAQNGYDSRLAAAYAASNLSKAQ
jgi:hypothetical protein